MTGCLLSGQISSSCVPCVIRQESESQWRPLKTWLLSVSTKPLEGVITQNVPSSRGYCKVWGASPRHFIRAMSCHCFGFSFPFVPLLPNLRPYFQIGRGVCTDFWPVDFSIEACASFSWFVYWEQVQGDWDQVQHSYLWSWNSLKARSHSYLKQPGGLVHLEVYFCWFLIYCLLGNQGTLTSFGKLLLQGTNWVDFDLSFFNLQFLYVNLKP